MSTSIFPPVPPAQPPARFLAVLTALRSNWRLVSCPPGCVFARIVSEPGQLASLVSASGDVLDPTAFRLFGQVSGIGAWLILVSVQPSLF